jgi:L-glyceraldehyde 3-phosphate reductase
LLTNRYPNGIPGDSRANKAHGFLKRNDISERRMAQVRALNELAESRGQSVAQLALAWVLRDARMTSALIGASRLEQVEQNVAALDNLAFTSEELAKIEAILATG